MESQVNTHNAIKKPLQQGKDPSRFLANTFLLIGIGMLVLSGSVVEGTLNQFLVGSIAEIILALMAIACVRLNKLPVKTTMRLNWPGWESLLLSIAAAPGLWMMGVALNLFTSLVLGYTTPTPPQMYPTNIWESLGFIYTAVIVAPICEELMFRGYIQRVYDRGKPLLGILIGGVIFALYHMQFQGLLALLPIAFTLGYVAWRTDSVIPGIVLHAAYNSIATTILITTTFLPYKIATALFVSIILIGIAGVGITVISLWRLWRGTSPKPLPQPGKVTRLTQWAWIIPLVILAIFYAYGSINEIIAGKFPEWLAKEELEFTPQPAWQQQLNWEYDIQDMIGTTLGSAECTLNPTEDGYQLICQGHNETSSFLDNIPWEIPWISGKFDILAADWERKVLWQQSNLQLMEFYEFHHLLDRSLTLTTNSQTLIMEDENASLAKLDIPNDVLVAGEWPWRLAGLPLDLFYGGAIPLVTFNNEGHVVVRDAFVSVRSAEPTWTTAGSFVTWKVTVTYTDAEGREITESAWYDTSPPHSLIRYEDGQLHYVIRSQTRQGQSK